MATGRDEMLKKNQQKSKKRKGLMQVLDDYRREQKQAQTYKPKNRPNLSEASNKVKKSNFGTKTGVKTSDYKVKPLGSSTDKKETKTKVAFGSGSFMKTNEVKPIGGGGSGEQKPPTRPMPTSEQANKGSGKDGKFGTGTYGQGRPSGGRGKKPVRGDYPAGEKGRRAYISALTTYTRNAPQTTRRSAPADKPKYNRRGRRVN